MSALSKGGLRWCAAVATALALLACAQALAQGRPGPGGPKPDDAARGLSLPPLEELGQTRDRPLFTPMRRPAPRQDAKPAESAKAGMLMLMGIVYSPGERVALLRVAGSEQVLRLSKGQEVRGWTVAEIEPDRVLLRSGDAAETLVFTPVELHRSGGKGSQRPPRRGSGGR